jgi:hypothetical protein
VKHEGTTVPPTKEPATPAKVTQTAPPPQAEQANQANVQAPPVVLINPGTAGREANRPASEPRREVDLSPREEPRRKSAKAEVTKPVAGEVEEAETSKQAPRNYQALRRRLLED